MVCMLIKVYTNDTWHQYAQEYLTLCILKCKHMTLAIRYAQIYLPLAY